MPYEKPQKQTAWRVPQKVDWMRPLWDLFAVLVVTLATLIVLAVTPSASPDPGALSQGTLESSEIFGTSLVLVFGLFAVIARRVHLTEEHENEKKLVRVVHETARLGYWELTEDGGIYWSPELYRVFGFDAPPSNLEEAYARIHPDDQEKARRQIDLLWKNGGRVDDEERLLLPDGTIRWLAYSCHAETNDDGKVVRLLGTTQDVTEQRNAEIEALQFQRLLDKLEDVYWVGDVSTDTFTFSAGAEALFGVPPEQISTDPESSAQFIHPDDLDTVQEANQRQIRGEPMDIEYRVIRDDGTVRWVRGRSWPAKSDRVPTFGIIRDITAEKELEDSRKTAEENAKNMKQLLDNLDEVYFVVDAKTGQTTVSDAVKQIYGRDPEEFHEDPDLWRKILIDDDKHLADQVLEETRQGKRSEVLAHIHRTDGSIRAIRSTVWPRVVDGEMVASIGIARDVTAEEEVDRLKELDEWKALFMNAAAHELNSPLTPIKLQAAILQQAHPDEPGLEVLHRNVERMERLVMDLLDASRLQAGRFKFEMNDHLDLTRLLQDTAEAYHLLAEEKGVRCDVTIDDHLVVRGDSVRLNQVITNLMTNAVKFTPEDGQIWLTASQQGDNVRIKIKDTGYGIDPEDLEGLFQPFHQFHHREVGTHTGTGLGLFISQSIVERLGGHITTYSEGKGKGATFTVTLPAVAPTDGASDDD